MADYVEGHPIPQDITGFQFRLIGDMTVKQFAYLTAGLAVGWIAFSLPLPFLIKLPVTAAIVLLGVIFAFVRIQGMSADAILLLFIKALVRPNQYVYDKSGKLEVGGGKEILTANTPVVSQQVLQTSPTSTIPQQTITPPSTVSVPQITPQSLESIVIPTRFAESEARRDDQQESRNLSIQPSRQTDPSISVGMTNTITANPQVRTLPAQPKKPVSIPFVTDIPNLIMGVIKDSRSNVLQNILIEVKDKDDNPVRAFKTNALGQFSSATPLLNGTYAITFEDPKKQHRFDMIELSAQGEILQPLEIVSIDQREELRKSLFETQNQNTTQA